MNPSEEGIDEALDDEQKAVLKAVRKWAKKTLPGARIRTVSVKNPIFQLWMPGKTPTDPAIPNDLRLRIVKDVLGATPLDPENVRYGNVQGNSLNLRWDQWKKVMEIERQPVESVVENLVPGNIGAEGSGGCTGPTCEPVDEANIVTLRTGYGFIVVLSATNADYYWTGKKWVTDKSKAMEYNSKKEAVAAGREAKIKGRSQATVA